jgi:hypothetical protein
MRVERIDPRWVTKDVQALAGYDGPAPPRSDAVLLTRSTYERYAGRMDALYALLRRPCPYVRTPARAARAGRRRARRTCRIRSPRGPDRESDPDLARLRGAA